MFAEMQAELDGRARQGLLRRRRLLQGPQAAQTRVDGAEVLTFCSNDYLGLANHPALIDAACRAMTEIGVGSGASHLITGHHQLHESLEDALAEFVGLPSALLFSTGYMANLGVVNALLRRGDAIFADKLNHASLNDAAIMARAELHRFRHNDLGQLENQLTTSGVRRKLVVVDAVFSMDGDHAPLPELLALCERHDAWLYLDDAHGFGVLGKQGRGALDHFALSAPRIIYMATLGKAAGVSGAFVAAEKLVIEYLIQHARTYVYTTATPPALAAAALAAIKVMQQDSERHARLHELIAYLKQHLRLRKWSLMSSDTAIQPLLVGDNQASVRLSEYLRDKGILVPAIRPPTVPAGTARLRISLSAEHTMDDLKRLIAVLKQAESELT